LFQIKCKSDLDKAAKLTKLRLQFENELTRFCQIDKRNLVDYLQRQLLERDQRIAEYVFDIEQMRASMFDPHDHERSKTNKKIGRIQILRRNDPDLVTSTVIFH
jgi:hypothetical protein